MEIYQEINNNIEQEYVYFLRDRCGFDRWNNLKKNFEHYYCRPEKFPKEVEVWMSAFGKNVGFEQNGTGSNFSRPVLVVKKFNNQMFWVVPLSTKQKSLDFYFNYTDPDNNNVVAILAQMKLVSNKRLIRNMYEIKQDYFIEIKQRLRNLL
jgi:mRNA interferase MazF